MDLMSLPGAYLVLGGKACDRYGSYRFLRERNALNWKSTLLGLLCNVVTNYAFSQPRLDSFNVTFEKEPVWSELQIVSTDFVKNVFCILIKLFRL